MIVSVAKCGVSRISLRRGLLSNTYFVESLTSSGSDQIRRLAVESGVVAVPAPAGQGILAVDNGLAKDASPAATVPIRFNVLMKARAADSGLRVDAALRESFLLADEDGSVVPIPVASLHKWARLKLLRVKQGSAAAQPLPNYSQLCSYRLNTGDEVLLHRDIAGKLQRNPDGRASSGNATAKWISPGIIRHSDAQLVAISKPASVPVQGGTGIDSADSVDALLPAISRAAATFASSQNKAVARPLASSQRSDDGQLRLVHRLDRDVSGLLLLARGRIAAGSLTRAFRDGTIRKTYLALVAAPLPPGVPTTGTITAPIVDVEFTTGKKGGVVLSKESEDAETRYTAHALTLPGSEGRGANGSGGSDVPEDRQLTLLYLEPMTGRKHQLRQHTLHLFRGAAAILGDGRYHAGLTTEMRRALGLPRATAAAALNPLRPWPSWVPCAPPSDGGIALHSLKAVIPASVLGSGGAQGRPAAPPRTATDAAPERSEATGTAPGDLLVKDSAGVPEWLRGLLQACGWSKL